MKLIVAYVQPHAIARLTQALLDIEGFPGMSVINCEGFGGSSDSGRRDFTPFQERKRVEIMTEDALAEPIMTRILQAAHTGNAGDGKVYMLDVGAAADIRTGARYPEV